MLEAKEQQKPVPATPSSVSVTRADGVLDASWPAVEHATSYHITYSGDGKASWSLAALNHTGTSITISGVDNAKTYVVGVRARNDSGDSGWTNSPDAGPYTPTPKTLSFGSTVADQSYTKDTAIDHPEPARRHRVHGQPCHHLHPYPQPAQRPVL